MDLDPADDEPIWRRPAWRPIVDSVYDLMEDHPRTRRVAVNLARPVLEWLGRRGRRRDAEELSTIELHVEGQFAARGRAFVGPMHRMTDDGKPGFVIDIPAALAGDLAHAAAASAVPVGEDGGEPAGEHGIPALVEAIRATRRLAIVAAHQPFPRLQGYQRQLLIGLRAAGFTILLVDAFNQDHGKLWANARDVADALIVRPNHGWDFRSWHVGLTRLLPHLDGLDELVLTNDSVFGPLFPLAEVFAQMAAPPVDFWGISDSYEIAYHLQSFFLVFRSAAIRSAAFREFFAAPRPTGSRSLAIRNGEIALTQQLTAAGLRAGSTSPYPAVAAAWLRELPGRLAALRNRDSDDARRAAEHHLRVESLLRRGRPVNPSHFFWDTLIRDFRCPFIKRELLLHNPVAVPNLAEVPRVIGETGYDLALIEEVRRFTPWPEAPPLQSTG